MRKFVKLCSIVLLVLLCIGFTACTVEPYKIDIWYLEYYEKDGVRYSVGHDEIEQTMLYHDDITIRYNEDKTFVFKVFGEEYTGIYTYKKGLEKGSVDLFFANGVNGYGTVAYYIINPRYNGVIYVDGIKYCFVYDDSSTWEVEERCIPYKDYGIFFKNMIEEDNVIGTHEKYHTRMYKGEIVERDGAYWFIYASGDIDDCNLSINERLYTYEVLSNYDVERGDNKLREGKCFININSWRITDETGNKESKCEYAVWYY